MKPVIFVGHRSDMTFYTDICESEGREVLGILDQYYYGRVEATADGIPIIGDERWLLEERGQHWLNSCEFFIGNFFNGVPNRENPSMSGNHLRDERIQLLHNTKANLANFIHPGSLVHKTAQIGRGVFIGWGTNIQAHAVVGNHCHIGVAGCVVGNNTTVGNNVTIMGPGSIGSGITIEDNVVVGPLHGIYLRAKEGKLVVGKNSIIHPNSVLYSSLPENSIWTRDNRRVHNHHVD
jgi:serine acetyltransferase